MPSSAAGKLEIVATCDIGRLGVATSAPAEVVWKRSSLLPPLMPWLAVLATLLLAVNRDVRAWWILVPLAVVPATNQLPTSIIDFVPSAITHHLLRLTCGGAFAVATVWMLAPHLIRTSRSGTAACVFSVLFVFGIATSAIGQDLGGMGAPPIIAFVVPMGLAGIVIAGALVTAGRMCRGGGRSLSVLMSLIVTIAGLWLVALGAIIAIAEFTSSTGVPWLEVARLVGVAAMLTFVAVVPFLVLSAANSLFRDRLHGLMHLAMRASDPASNGTAGAAGPACLAGDSNQLGRLRSSDS